jgi:hypothetical protein
MFSERTSPPYQYHIMDVPPGRRIFASVYPLGYSERMKLTIETNDYYLLPEESTILELNSDLEKLFLEAAEAYNDFPDGWKWRELAVATLERTGESVRIKVSDQGQSVVFRPEEGEITSVIHKESQLMVTEVINPVDDFPSEHLQGCIFEPTEIGLTPWNPDGVIITEILEGEFE